MYIQLGPFISTPFCDCHCGFLLSRATYGLHPNLRTMFFDSAKEKKEEKEKEGGTVSLWREVIGTIQRLENYRALIEMSVFPY